MSAAARRQQILDEATRIIGQRGYFGFSVQEVADSCGLTQAGLLHHVGSKDQLLTAVLEERDARDVAALGGLMEQYAVDALADAFEIGLEDAVDCLHRLVERNASQPEIVRLYSVLRNESLEPGHPSHQFFRDRDARALRFFRQLFVATVAEPGSFARQVLALMGGLEEQWLRAPDEVDLVAEWDRAMAVLVAGRPV
ncbi:helix-turn-helix domain-containing protein [Isoptericola sp. b441]|uniref:Helix-turn-helix domain-containing protein n=1 Tax=Actinotalea lenta TaxID=3064654 RepID=A0ABT9DF30_9CELL|nr:TetR/AcrR family transcriptional regulator [Isoptericola sp. b441]MDO8108343.1 helix-turn-helix domain-containing protein [Isoptericola sp. b441]